MALSGAQVRRGTPGTAPAQRSPCPSQRKSREPGARLCAGRLQRLWLDSTSALEAVHRPPKGAGELYFISPAVVCLFLPFPTRGASVRGLAKGPLDPPTCAPSPTSSWARPLTTVLHWAG